MTITKQDLPLLSLQLRSLATSVDFDPNFLRKLEADPEAMAACEELVRLLTRMGEFYRFARAGRRAAAKYDITEDQFWEVVISQGFACAICRAEFEPGGLTFAVDHNHETNAVRGVLCHTCNSGLGMFKDSPDILDAALAYLEDRGHYGANSPQETA